MSVWDSYQNRINVHGDTRRKAAYNREVRMLSDKMRWSLSYHDVVIDDVPRNVAIIDSDNLNEKYMYSLPGEDFDCGGLVEWAENHWLISEKDANTEVYTRVKLLQCNHLLKWIDEEDIIHEQWCVIEDGTKLKHTDVVCNSLAYWKRYAKTIPLIVWKLLRALPLKRKDETRLNGKSLKTARIGQSAAKLRTGERSTAIPVAGVHSSEWKRGTLNHLWHGEDIACAV